MADNEEIDVKEYYSEAIKSLVPINELSPNLQNEIINIAVITEYKKKDFIFKQGDRDEYAFYLLDGEVELLADNHVQSKLVSSTDSARYAMARLQPRQFSARAASKKVVILQLDRGALDRLMVAEPQSQELGSGEMEVAEIEAEETGDWMSRMLQSELFCRLPTANIHQLFALLEPVEFNAGDQVIKQGDTGEYYYIIQEGRCEVTRAPSPGAKPVKLAELHAGDSFGEEALLTDAKRNASISMLTDGVLMQLSKDNFINLIKKPSLEVISFNEGREQVASGAVWLDVRFKNEHEQSHIEGSINIPLNILRTQLDKLDTDKRYIIYCDTGGRSSAAAFLLTDRGYNVCYLREGLSSVPDSELKGGAETGSPEPAAKEAAEQPAKEQAKPAPVPAPKVEAKAEKEEINNEDLEPAVRSSVIETNLARNNMELEAANKQLREADARKARELKDAKKKLEAEKKKLEAEKKAIEKEAQKLRKKEEERLKKLKEEAEKRLSEEKNRLEEVYNRNTKEMEKLQRQKEEAEEQLKKEREKFERETAEARKKLEEEAEKRKQQQEAMERAIQLKAKAKLEAEKRKMAEEFSRTNEELEKARKAKAMAEAARQAAQDEAKNIIEEYKKQFEKEQASEKARMEEERKKLEEESRKIQETYLEIQRAKEEAEKARAAAEKEVAELKTRQKAGVSASESKAVADEIRAVEERLQEAEKNVKEAESAGESIQAARAINEEELKRQKEIAEEMRAQVEADLAEFMEQQQEEEKGKENVVEHSDHIKRIKERAEAAKREAEKATDDLFADIAAQLGKDE